jgi:calcineurin-like phosphoesterase family protein
VKDIFLISDTHWRHTNIIEYGQRPFSSTEEMDEALVNNWNSVVNKEDKVYHLGDVYMSDSITVNRLLSRLNGTKVLILGNHDDGKDKILLSNFKRIHSYRFLKDHGMFLSHVPIHQSSISSKLKVNVHGHTHEKGSPPGPYLSVCVEKINYTPINIEELKLAITD